MDPIFLELDEILRIHQDQVNRYGGSTRIRDINILKSAIKMPAATYEGQFLHKDIFEMAAAYLFHISQNHPFVDGNKRVGIVSALVFLELNGIDFNADEDDLEQIVMKVAEGKSNKSEIADFFRKNSRSVRK